MRGAAAESAYLSRTAWWSRLFRLPNRVPVTAAEK
jgi:hypothetical protein